MEPVRSLSQTYAYLACQFGAGDDELDYEMSAICTELQLHKVELYGRLEGLEIEWGCDENNAIPFLVVTLQARTVTQVLRLDLRQALAHALLRKLDHMNFNAPVSVCVWMPSVESRSTDFDDDCFAAAYQGRWLPDSYLGDPWKPGLGEGRASFDDPSYAVRVISDALKPYDVMWHVKRVAELQTYIRAAQDLNVKRSRCPTAASGVTNPFTLGTSNAPATHNGATVHQFNAKTHRQCYESDPFDLS